MVWFDTAFGLLIIAVVLAMSVLIVKDANVLRLATVDPSVVVRRLGLFNNCRVAY